MKAFQNLRKVARKKQKQSKKFFLKKMDLVTTKFRDYKHLQETGTNDDKTPTASSVEQV